MASRRKKNNVKEWVIIIIILAAVFFVFRGGVFRSVEVKGVSMENTLEHGDIVIINRWLKLENGDIVVYKNNRDEKIIKRVIGCPGDVVDIKFNGLYDDVYVNGEMLDEDEFIKETMYQKGDADYPVTVPDGEYFLMGDNRNVSNDSRQKENGTIPREKIMGKVIVRIFPLGKLGMVE